MALTPGHPVLNYFSISHFYHVSIFLVHFRKWYNFAFLTNFNSRYFITVHYKVRLQIENILIQNTVSVKLEDFRWKLFDSKLLDISKL